MPASCACCTVACSSAVESRPPLKATATRRGAGSLASALGGVGETAVRLKPLVATLHQVAHRQVAHLAERIVERALQEGGHLLGIAVRAADGLVDDLVDEPERLQTMRGDAELLGRIGRPFGRLPEDRGA